MKNDTGARQAWGLAYDAIPKSVFALTAWHLANVASESCDAPGYAEARMIEEIEAMASNDLMDAKQAERAIKAVRALSNNVPTASDEAA